MLEKRVGYKFLSNLDVGKAGSLVTEHFFYLGKVNCSFKCLTPVLGGGLRHDGLPLLPVLLRQAGDQGRQERTRDRQIRKEGEGESFIIVFLFRIVGNRKLLGFFFQDLDLWNPEISDLCDSRRSELEEKRGEKGEEKTKAASASAAAAGG